MVFALNEPRLYYWRVYFDPQPEVLRLLRKKKGLIQKQAADRFGKKQALISDWETGKVRISRKLEQSYFEALRVSDEEVEDAYFEVIQDQRRRRVLVGRDLGRTEELLEQLARHLPEAVTTTLKSQLMTAEAAAQRWTWDFRCTLEALLANAKSSEPSK